MLGSLAVKTTSLHIPPSVTLGIMNGSKSSEAASIEDPYTRSSNGTGSLHKLMELSTLLIPEAMLTS
jgi:hypothetical protein